MYESIIVGVEDTQDMPYDQNGYHATGRTFITDVYQDGQFLYQASENEYEDWYTNELSDEEVLGLHI